LRRKVAEEGRQANRSDPPHATVRRQTAEEVSMIVPFMDRVTGTAVYINPAEVVTVRPDPDAPEQVSIIKLRDGESIRVNGDHEEVAAKLDGAA